MKGTPWLGTVAPTAAPITAPAPCRELEGRQPRQPLAQPVERVRRRQLEATTTTMAPTVTGVKSVAGPGSASCPTKAAASSRLSARNRISRARRC